MDKIAYWALNVVLGEMIVVLPILAAALIRYILSSAALIRYIATSYH